MSTALALDSAPRPWSAEPTGRPDRRRVRAHIGGPHCSPCPGTIKKALSRKRGVYRGAVSLTYEQALVEFDRGLAEGGELMRTLTDMGYTLSEPRKVEPFEKQERALVREHNSFLGVLGLSLAVIGLIAPMTVRVSAHRPSSRPERLPRVLVHQAQRVFLFDSVWKQGFPCATVILLFVIGNFGYPRIVTLSVLRSSH